MKYKDLTVPNDCEHSLVIYLRIQKGTGSRPNHIEGKCLNCKAGITIKEDYQKLDLLWDFWNRKKPIYSKR